MRPRPYRKAVAELSALCAATGIALEQSNRGKGSHRTLTFIDSATSDRVAMVISAKKEITLVVQRGMIAHLIRRANTLGVGTTARDHNERVRLLLEGYFDS